MATIDLEVPYDDRNLAKSLGARWNPQRKVWYIDDQRDLAPFQQWLPQPTRINHRSVGYFLLISHRLCWKCQSDTSVYGFALPSGHEALEYIDDESVSGEDELGSDDDGTPTWMRRENPEVILYASSICEGALASMAGLTRHYMKDFSATTRTRYYMNHCEHCDAKLGDFDTIEEFDAPLTPLYAPTPDRLRIIPVDAHFESESDTTPLPFASSDSPVSLAR